MLRDLSMENIQKNNIVLKFLGFVLAIAPALLIATLIFKNSVNVPFWDDWEVSFFMVKVSPEFRLTLEDLISQHNESRYVFPRLIFTALTYINNGNWDLRSQMWVSFGVLCLVSLNIFGLINLTNKKSLPRLIFLTIISNCLIFAPIQYENIFWGIQLIVFMPIACITTALVVIYSDINKNIKLFICLLLCTISTYSYANGILIWIILFPAFAISESPRWQDFFKQKWLCFPWIAIFISNIVVYFYNYQKPAFAFTSYNLGFVKLNEIIQFFLSLLGSSLGRGKIPSDVIGSVNKMPEVVNNVHYVIIIGAILAILFIAVYLYLWKERKNFALIYRMVPWLTIGSYVVISAIIISWGRVGFGLETALAFRYMTFSIYLPLALVNSIAIIYDDAENKYLLEKRKILAKIGIGSLLLVFLYFYLITSNFAIGRISQTKLDRLQGKACLSFINVVTEEICLTQKLYPDLPNLKPRVQLLRDFRLIDTKFVNSNLIQEIAENPIDSYNPIKYGAFDQISKVDNQSYFASGWAILPQKRKPADAVVLTYAELKGKDIIFAISDTRVKRPDVVKGTKNQAYSMSGWQKTFPASRLPKGLLKINAWAFDTDRAKAYQIGGTHVLENQ